MNLTSSDSDSSAERPIEDVREAHPFRCGSFRLLWAALAISTVGDQLYRVGLLLHTAEEGPIGLATLGFVMALPLAVAGVFAGVLVDRHDRWKLLVTSDLARAFVVTILGVVLLSGRSSLVADLVLVALLSFIGVIFTPAVQTVLPILAGGRKRQLIAMDAWILGTLTCGGVIGPALAGVLLQVLEPGWLMVLDALTFVASAVLVCSAGRRAQAVRAGLSNQERFVANAASPAGKSASAALQGLRFIMRHRVLGPCFRTFPLMDLALNSTPFVLLLMLSATGSDGQVEFGAMVAALAFGRVCGMAVLNKTQLREHRGRVLRTNFLVQGTGVVLVAVLTDHWLGITAMFLVGLMPGAAQVAMASYVQAEVPPEMRGRVFGALGSLVTWLAPCGPVLFVGLAGFTTPRTGLFVIAAVLFIGGLRLYFCRSLRDVR